MKVSVLGTAAQGLVGIPWKMVSVTIQISQPTTLLLAHTQPTKTVCFFEMTSFSLSAPF